MSTAPKARPLTRAVTVNFLPGSPLAVSSAMSPYPITPVTLLRRLTRQRSPGGFGA